MLCITTERAYALTAKRDQKMTKRHYIKQVLFNGGNL